MAPRKEKVEKVSANEAADTILNYLRMMATLWLPEGANDVLQASRSELGVMSRKLRRRKADMSHGIVVLIR
jgi:hypothetical protein